ncbi:MAG: hypothetical protein LBP76_07395 [Treponema sp.]|jgi:outer membrane protein insertion porin family|nr:hypothetical protein [Treponema sp.]
MRYRLLIGLLLITYAVFAGEWYVDKPVKDIVFSGLEHVKAEELLEITVPYVGRLFTEDAEGSWFLELEQKLYSLGYFESITPSAIPADPAGTELIIKFTVKEHPRVLRIDFLGNDHIRRGRLLEELAFNKEGSDKH